MRDFRLQIGLVVGAMSMLLMALTASAQTTKCPTGTNFGFDNVLRSIFQLTDFERSFR